MPVRDCPRLRPELTWSRIVSDGRETLMFKDPVALEYMRLDEIGGELATQMDGTRTVDDLLEYARQRWPGLVFEEDYIRDLLNDLRDLKYLDDPFQTHALLKARAKAERAQINAATFKNLFAVQLGWMDPDRLLNRTYPYVRFMFQPLMVWIGALMFVSAGYVVWLNRDLAASNAGNLMLGEGNRLLGALLIFLVITGVIIIHEFGHAFAVKHHGGRVHKLGFMMIFGMPCMFCDTSDTLLWSKMSHRVHVALAGTYTELYSAAIATVVWWLTPPGSVINQLSYNIILFASVSGILFNYNPLLKMDGYYVLSDVLEMPNLQEDAYEYVGWLFRRRVLGMKVESPIHGRRRKRILFLYGAASIAYSAFFATMMYLFMRRLLVSKFSAIGALLSVGLLVVVLRRPLEPTLHTLRLWWLESGSRLGSPRGRVTVAVAAALVLIGLLFFVPFPGARSVSVALEPARRVALVAPEEMRLRWIGFQAGQPVRAGQVLALLDADSAAVIQGESEARTRGLEIAAARALERGDMAESALQSTLAGGEAGNAQTIARRVERATLRAPIDGRVLTVSTPGRLGTRLEPGDTVCVVGSFARPRAVAIVPEADLDDFRVGAPARVRLRAFPWLGFDGKVRMIESLPLESKTGRAYRVWLDLTIPPHAPAASLRAGLTGKARLQTPTRVAAAHFSRFVARFLRVDLWV